MGPGCSLTWPSPFRSVLAAEGVSVVSQRAEQVGRVSRAGPGSRRWADLLAPARDRPRQALLRAVRAFAADSKSLDELRKPKFTSKYLINHVSEKLIPAVRSSAVHHCIQHRQMDGM